MSPSHKALTDSAMWSRKIVFLMDCCHSPTSQKTHYKINDEGVLACGGRASTGWTLGVPARTDSHKKYWCQKCFREPFTLLEGRQIHLDDKHDWERR